MLVVVVSRRQRVERKNKRGLNPLFLSGVLEGIGQRDEEEVVWEIEDADDRDDARGCMSFSGFEEGESERIDVYHREEEPRPVDRRHVLVSLSTKAGAE